jgi:hypothetical protein
VRHEAAASEFRTVVAPLGASLAGSLALLVGAWGAIAVFVGPTFGYRPTSYNSWDWTTQNWLLHLIPGAVGFVAGMMVIEETRRRKVGSGKRVSLPALLLMAAGIWFVIGPAVWPTFESAPAFATGVSAGRSALNVIGSSYGPGLLLAILGGMAWKAAIARPALSTVPVAPPAPEVFGAGADAAPAERGVEREPGAPTPATTPATTEAAPDAPVAERGTGAEPDGTEGTGRPDVRDQAV